MHHPIKKKIYELLESIEDESILNQVMEDVTYYTSGKDGVDAISPVQLKELDEAISKADKGDTVSSEEFKKEMREWKKL